MIDALAIFLYPSTPKNTAVDPAAFATQYLPGLKISAFQVSFDHPKPSPPPSPFPPGELIGEANYDPSKPKKNRIRQQFFLSNVGIPKAVPGAVAIAIIDIPGALDQPPGSPMFLNVALLVERNSKRIADHSINYDVTTVTYPGPALPMNFTLVPGLGPIYDDLAVFPTPSLYLALPINSTLAGGLPGIDVSADGSPPAYPDLLAAVNAVLAKDPGSSPDLGTLTPAQCLHIARELVSNRAFDPLPHPSKDFGDLYTAAPLGGANDDDRSKFQTSLLAYYATLDAKAARLGQYIFALSAAAACSQRTTVATAAGLRFPVLMSPGSTGPVAENEVILHD